MLVWPLRCPSWRLVRTRESHCLTWLLPFCLHQPSLLGPSVVRVLEGRLLPPGCAPGGGSNPLDLILLDIAPNSLRKVLLKNKRLKQWLFFIVQKHDFSLSQQTYTISLHPFTSSNSSLINLNKPSLSSCFWSWCFNHSSGILRQPLLTLLLLS